MGAGLILKYIFHIFTSILYCIRKNPNKKQVDTKLLQDFQIIEKFFSKFPGQKEAILTLLPPEGILLHLIKSSDFVYI